MTSASAADPALPREPRLEYEARLAAWRERAARARRRGEVLAHARLAVFVAGLAGTWLVLASSDLSKLWIAAFAAGFGALVIAHDRARRREEGAQRAVRFYERGLQRLTYAFAGTGASGERFADPSHAYADHLDLFGRGSLFELLCGAQTRAGEEKLASWLKTPAAPDEIRARQAAAQELRPRLDLREALAVRGPEVREGLHPEALVAWGSGAPEVAGRATRVAAAGLAAATVACGGAALGTGVGAEPLLLALSLAIAAELVFAVRFRARTRRVARSVEGPLRDLALLSELLLRLERERFAAPALVALQRAVETQGAPASHEIAQLRRLVDLLRSRQNQFFAPIAPLVLWTTQVGFAIEAWRSRCGPWLGRWIEAIGELEALCDLASHAFEHPADPFPEICGDAPRFHAENLGHPLLPEAACVRNDLHLDAEHALLVVSGSNMSGKTTLLRTVGANTVLALAGAPVRARRMRLSPLHVGGSVLVHDSLQEGSSRFYSEITRLRRIVDLADGALPVLFLLDEILGGTNSHDRGIGAAAVVRALVERGGIGLVTTHDLQLARIADDLAPRAANVHFEDQLVDGRMDFDYKLREGVVTRSNALALMRAVGLNV